MNYRGKMWKKGWGCCATVVWLGLQESWKAQKGEKKVAMILQGKTKIWFQMASCHHRQDKWLYRICWSVQDVYFSILVTVSRNVSVFYTKIKFCTKLQKPSPRSWDWNHMFFSFAIFLVLLNFYLCSCPFSEEKEKKIVNHMYHLCG